MRLLYSFRTLLNSSLMKFIHYGKCFHFMETYWNGKYFENKWNLFLKTMHDQI